MTAFQIIETIIILGVVVVLFYTYGKISKYVFELYYTIDKHKKRVLLVGFIVTSLLGFGTYWCIYHLNIIPSLYYTLSLFMFDVKTPVELGLDNDEIDYIWIYGPAILAGMMSTLTILLLFFKEFIHELYAAYIVKSKSHIIVVGLGKKGMSYIDSELSKKNNNKHIIVIEKDVKNQHIKEYREKYYKQEFAIHIGDASTSELLSKMNISDCEHLVLLAGKDTTNIEIALAISRELKECTQNVEYKNLFMHLEDSDLHNFYRAGGLFDDSSLLHIKMFSMDKNSARSLFLIHDIDGNGREYINTNKAFNIAVVGNSNLALEIIGQACEIAHFPNENEMTIHCIDSDIETYKKYIFHRYPGIGNIPNIKLKFQKIDFKSRRFYRKAFWLKDMTNVILCNTEAQINLDIASQLIDTTYLKCVVDKSMNTKIHIAIYDNEQIAENINLNTQQFKYMYAFAEISKMASEYIVIDEGIEVVAKCIHGAYSEKYEPEKIFYDEEIEEKWFKNSALSDRDSNRAQAYHLSIKIKALGFKIDSPKCKSHDGLELLESNRILFDSNEIGMLNARKNIIQNGKLMPLDDMSLVEKTKNYITIPDPNDKNKNIQESYKVAEEFDYFPESVNTLFEKIVRSEKNRWNAHHYLRGWKQTDVKKKELKIHNCLVPFLDLPKDKRYTVLYDIYSILYIPNFLVKINKRLKFYDDIKIGVTGHRDIDDSVEIVKKIEDEIKKIKSYYNLIEIYSPLADGADRYVAKVLLEKYDSKLIVPLPFKMEEYKKDFSEKSTHEFNKLLETVTCMYEVDSLDKHTRSDCYFSAGKEVVNKCDILIALWDGNEADGISKIGGTAYVVDYARKQNKPIIHINTSTDKYEVQYINFEGILSWV